MCVIYYSDENYKRNGRNKYGTEDETGNCGSAYIYSFYRADRFSLWCRGCDSGFGSFGSE